MGSPNRTSAYDEDLAYIHDVGFGAQAERSAPGLLRLFRQAGIDEGRVIDLGCGSGIWANRLNAAGYDVLGIDYSPAMIELARRRAPRAEFRVASFVTADLPPCRAVTALSEVLSFRFDRASGVAALRRLFRRVYEALEPGGLFVFDLPEVGLNRDRPPSGFHGSDWACVVDFHYDDRRDQLERRITTFRQVGRHYRRGEETHRVQLYRPGPIATALRRAGFVVRVVRRYGDYQLTPQRFGVIGRR